DPRLRNVGANERRVYDLVNGQRDVQKIIDLSGLGEFETCKCLVTLLDAGFIRQSEAGKRTKASAESLVGGIKAPHFLKRAVFRSALGAVFVLVLIVGAIKLLGLPNLLTASAPAMHQSGFQANGLDDLWSNS